MTVNEEIISIQRELKIPPHVLCMILQIPRADYKKFKRNEIKPTPRAIHLFTEIVQRPLYTTYPYNGRGYGTDYLICH